MRAAYRRVTDLFQHGTEAILDDEGPEPLLVWVQKLNSFQREECVRDGQVARSRAILALRSDGSDELLIFRAFAGGMTPPELTEQVLGAQAGKLLLAASEELQADPEWTERSAVLERSGEQLAERAADDPERALVEGLQREHADELSRRMDARRADLRAELEHLSPVGLLKRYEESYLEARGTTEFIGQYQRTEVFYASRICRAKRTGDGFDHGGCDHTERLFDSREEVAEAPAGLLERLRAAIDRLEMTPREAKNSPRRRSSSASSPPPSTPEPSTVSGPVVTSNGQGGISASPSPTP